MVINNLSTQSLKHIQMLNYLRQAKKRIMQPKFINCTHSSNGTRILVNGKFLVIINDITYYNENRIEIAKWIKKHIPVGCDIDGIMIKFSKSEDCLYFLMRWT